MAPQIRWRIHCVIDSFGDEDEIITCFVNPIEAIDFITENRIKFITEHGCDFAQHCAGGNCNWGDYNTNATLCDLCMQTDNGLYRIPSVEAMSTMIQGDNIILHETPYSIGYALDWKCTITLEAY